MANPAELVPLLYHADWTTWSFSADIVVRRRPSVRAGSGAVGRGPEWVESRHRIQMAPGGRYRIEPVGAGDPQDGDHAELATLVVCDGQSCWIISGNEAERHVADPERTAIDDIVHPSWLLSGFQLAVTGEGEVAGRAAHELRGTPRLPIRHPPMTGYGYIDHVNVLVDAELGMVLRWEAISADRPVEIVELQDLAVDQRADQDPALFRPGTGIVVEDGFGPLPADSGHGLDWQGRGHESSGTGDDADTVAATLGSAALGLALRRLARAEPPRGSGLDDEAAMPAADDDEPPGDPEPASDELLNLIARTGLPRLNLTAQAHRWVDVQTALHGYRSVVTGFDHERMQQFTSGFFGPDSIWSWVRGGHRSARLRVAMPDRYLIDYWRDERRRQPLAVACDSHRLRKAYHNRVVSGPAQPLPAEFVRLLHPAWLLSGWKLTAAGQGTVGGRAVFRVIAELPPRAPGLPVQPERSSDRPRDRPPDAALRIIVMVDAELGILLRQVSFVDAQPAVRFELRDVSCHRSAKAADFALRAAPALPVIDSDGEPLDDLDLHPLVRAAGEAADTVLAGLQTALGRLSAQVRRAKDASAGRWP